MLSCIHGHASEDLGVVLADVRRAAGDAPRRRRHEERRARVAVGAAEVVVLDLDREAAGHEVLGVERLLRRRDHAAREPAGLAADEEVVGGDALGDEHQRLAAGAEDLDRQRVGGHLGDGDTPPRSTARSSSTMSGNSSRRPSVTSQSISASKSRLAAGREAGGDVATVGAEHLASASLIVVQRVPAGLALHRAPGDQPLVAAGLGRDVGRRVHAHVDVLAAPGDVARQHRGERRHHRERAADVEGLVAAAAHRRQRVVVVAAAPHRAAAGQQREVGGRLVRARAGAPERRDRHPDELLVVVREVGVVEVPGGERAGRLALEDDVGLGRRAGGSARRRRRRRGRARRRASTCCSATTRGCAPGPRTSSTNGP